MDNKELQQRFATLSTPLIADACLRLGIAVRQAPPGIRPIRASERIAGRVRPTRHYGSVDIFLKAVWSAQAGDILTIDNSGRLDEGCIGDLITLEARAAGIAGIVLWGAFRDTSEVLSVGLPVFAYGTSPTGPQRLDPIEPAALESARFGAFTVSAADIVVADRDGALFVAGGRVGEVLSEAEAIRTKEAAQAQAVRAGRTLREQLRFDEYWEARTRDPEYTFRQHLGRLGGAIEA